MKTAILLTALVMIGVAAPATARNAFRDGSFEKPRIPDGSLMKYLSGTTLRGWEVVGGPVSLVTTAYTAHGFHFTAHNSTQSLNLAAGDTGASGVQQQVNIVPYQNYALTFWIGAVYDPNGRYGDTCYVELTFNGENDGILFFKANAAGGTQQQWAKQSLSFMFNVSSLAIGFKNHVDVGSGRDCGIDEVRLEPIPAAAGGPR